MSTKKKQKQVKAPLKKTSSVKFEYWTSEEGLSIIEGAILKGYTIDNICKLIGIARKTFYDWCKKNKQIDNIRFSSLEKKEMLVNNALFKGCTGFTENKVYYPPDPRMMKLFYELRENAKRRQEMKDSKPTINVSIQIDSNKPKEILDLDKGITEDEILNDG